ncbi:hypothetical protein EB796_019134 [Bugula neritina]|uniref:Transmembrane protein 254 n=1 Tax=Bugula neritina TaxID=10212 RepID=A0A7J7J948_BUGNE|nr:hypothetical protein EB796_019134 [Bugula neritina]
MFFSCGASPIMSSKATVPPDWFRTPHPGYWAVILSGLGALGLTYYAPDVAISSLGPLSPICRYLIEDNPTLLQMICYGALIAHIFEGSWTFLLTRKLKLNYWTTVRWTLQTTIVGFPSMCMIRAKAKLVTRRKDS